MAEMVLRELCWAGTSGMSRSLGMLHFKLKNRAAIEPITQCPFPASIPPTGTGQTLVCLILAEQRGNTYPQAASSIIFSLSVSPIALCARAPAVVTVRMQP